MDRGPSMLPPRQMLWMRAMKRSHGTSWMILPMAATDSRTCMETK